MSSFRACTLIALGYLLVLILIAGTPSCSTNPPRPSGPPPGYTNDVSPYSDGSELIGGAP